MMRSWQFQIYIHMKGSQITSSWTFHVIVIALIQTTRKPIIITITISSIHSHERITDTKLMKLSCNCHSFNINKTTYNNYLDHDNFTEIFIWNIQRYQAHEHFMLLSLLQGLLIMRSWQFQIYIHMEGSQIPSSWTFHAIVIALIQTTMKPIIIAKIMTTPQRYSHGI